jgi:FdhD protein
MPDAISTRRTVTAAPVLAVRDGEHHARPDRLATEEPMEIQAAGPGQEPGPVAVTMRTPGHDFELAVGFLWTEGLLTSPDDLISVRYCEVPPDEQHFNVVTVRLAREFDVESVVRNFYATSSCGICGKASLEQVHVRCAGVAPGPTVPSRTILGMPGALREAQRIFDETGGLHAAGLFDPTGRLIAVREDVGRHNAVDKLVGMSVLANELPLSDRVLLVSGRVSFEIVQKAAMAGIPLVCAVSAPTSLAAEAADGLGMTVIGFLRDRGFNVYTHPERVDLDA